MRISDWSSDVCPSDRLEFRVGRHAEAADSPHRFGKGADDEIHLVGDARFLEDTAPMLAEKAHAVRFVHQHHRAVLLGDGDHLLKWRDIAQHRIDALEDDELDSHGGKPAGAMSQRDRKSDGWGKSVEERVEWGGRRK